MSPRKPTMAQAERFTKHLAPGTAAIVKAITDESFGTSGWRPARAGALVAVADGESREWMSAAQFSSFIERHGLARKHGAAELLKRELDIGPKRRLNLMVGAAKATKIEALAIAHFSLGLERPIPAEDCDAFAVWFGARFGDATEIGAWLGCRGDYISQRIKGFEVMKGHRWDRLPESSLIRALDWVWTVGPVAPFGGRPALKLWPRQEGDRNG